MHEKAASDVVHRKAEEGAIAALSQLTTTQRGAAYGVGFCSGSQAQDSRFSWPFAAVTILLLAVETGIAAFVTGFVRDYVGDVLVVVLVYCLVRSFVSLRTGLLPLLVFVFAAAVELSQKLGLVTALGLENVPVARTVLGTTFDSSDIACYAVGCLMLLVVEIAVHVTRRSGGR